MSTTRARTLGVSLAILGLAACNPFGQPAVELSPGDASLNSRWHANLATPATLAGAVQMSGSATMAPDEDGGSTIVTLDLTNASPGGRHPWEARVGECGTEFDGGVFGDREDYEALEVGSDGEATATATVQVRTPEAGRYFVVVHASDVNSKTVVACGNLAAPTR